MAIIIGAADNAHPWQCGGCGQQFTTRQYSARCCQVSTTHEDTGETFAWDPDWDAKEQARKDAEWEKEMEEYHYECSCGERYKTIQHAIDCRKCRTYTTKGWCTEVYDTDTGEIVWDY